MGSPWKEREMRLEVDKRHFFLIGFLIWFSNPFSYLQLAQNNSDDVTLHYVTYELKFKSFFLLKESFIVPFHLCRGILTEKDNTYILK